MDYFEILGIGYDAGEKDVKKAFRKLALDKHPDKNNGSEGEFKLIHDAYMALMDEGNRKMLAEKIGRERLRSEEVKKMREELIRKEKVGVVSIPKKRFERPRSETNLEVKKTGVRVEWDKNKIFTQKMIEQVFQEFGGIIKVVTDNFSAKIIFVNEMATDRAVARPPCFFRVRRLAPNDCASVLAPDNILKQTSEEISEKLKILRAKLQKRENSDT